MYWYVLFVRVGREGEIIQLLKKQLNPEFFKPFTIVREEIFKSHGVEKREQKILFPGYIFIESKKESIDFIIETRNIFHLVTDIISLLRYSETEVPLKEAEKQVLLDLCNDDYCIELSNGILGYDELCIIDGPLKGLENRIKKINRHKRQAYIELEFMGEIKLVKVSLETICKS